ncbi:hypothetical protein BZA77DRAFT_31943 [Pyronema omphalodes]|nr:hypothetical protein BZA77DRAFT_31943 [Pyronema omphalodes]
MDLRKVYKLSPLPRASNGSGRGQNYDRKKKSGIKWWLTLTVAAFALSSIPKVSADTKYCSKTNTGDGDGTISTFQSVGLCTTQCQSSFAFAVLQGKYCWCSNYAPSTPSDGTCDSPCPGYPADQCGNLNDNLYAYIQLPNKVLGTKGPASSTVSPTSSLPAVITIVTTKGPTETVIITSINSATKSSSAPSTTSTFQTITTTAATAIATNTSSPTSTSAASAENSSFTSSPGKVAGLIVGLIIALLLIVAAVLFWRRRRNQRDSALYGSSQNGLISAGGAGFFGGGRRGRSMSTLGLVGEKSPPSSQSTPPVLDANGVAIAQPPRTAGAPNGVMTDGEAYDQRLDPQSLFMKFDPHTGSSRMSVRSLRDDTDYSRRVLRLANPDD